MFTKNRLLIAAVCTSYKYTIQIVAVFSSSTLNVQIVFFFILNIFFYCFLFEIAICRRRQGQSKYLLLKTYTRVDIKLITENFFFRIPSFSLVLDFFYVSYVIKSFDWCRLVLINVFVMFGLKFFSIYSVFIAILIRRVNKFSKF